VPNPVNGAIRVVFALATDEPARLELIDLAGRLRVSRPIAGRLPQAVTLADARSLEAGIYIVRLVQGIRERTTKAVVVR
jgi:hypothetical protein